MIKTVRSVSGQSIYDICLQVYGGLDLLVKLCTDNGITNADNFPPGTVFSYDDALVINPANTGRQYVTQVITPPTICAPVTGLTVFGITGSEIDVEWAASPGSIRYGYAINTTGLTPTAPDGYTSDTTLSILDLDPTTLYYIFICNFCSTNSRSLWTNTSATTVSDCTTPEGLSITDVSSNDAIGHWIATLTGVPYQYAVTTANIDPGVFHVDIDGGDGAVELSTVTQTGLSLQPSTTYYFQLRRDCGSGNFSSWAKKSFTTTA